MKNFSDYNFKPSDVIDGLNRFYEFTENHKDYPYTAFTIHTSEPSKSAWAFSKSRVPDAITYLREECDIFYTPGMKWDDLKYKLPTKACEKEFGTTDIREMYPGSKFVKPRIYPTSKSFKRRYLGIDYSKLRSQREAAKKYSLKQFEKDLGIKHIDMPWELSRDESEKMMNYCMNDVICSKELMREKERLDGKEALEAIRDIYDELDCPGEAQWRRMNGYDTINEVPTLHMRDYIINKYKYFRDLSEFAWEQNKKLKDLINQIHEDSDI